MRFSTTTKFSSATPGATPRLPIRFVRREKTQVIEAFFTSKGDTLYAITPWWPAQRFVLKNVPTSAETVLTMLGLSGRLKWRAAGPDLVVAVAKLSMDEAPCPCSYTLKVTRVNRGG